MTRISLRTLLLMLEKFRPTFSPTQLSAPGSPRIDFNFTITLLFITLLFFFSSKQSIYVTKVQPDGPAAFGLVPGDRILEVGEYFCPYILCDQCC